MPHRYSQLSTHCRQSFMATLFPWDSKLCWVKKIKTNQPSYHVALQRIHYYTLPNIRLSKLTNWHRHIIVNRTPNWILCSPSLLSAPRFYSGRFYCACGFVSHILPCTVRTSQPVFAFYHLCSLRHLGRHGFEDMLSEMVFGWLALP